MKAYFPKCQTITSGNYYLPVLRITLIVRAGTRHPRLKYKENVLLKQFMLLNAAHKTDILTALFLTQSCFLSYVEVRSRDELYSVSNLNKCHRAVQQE